MVRDNLGKNVDAFLATRGLKRSDIGSWIMHTGGPKVLEATAEALGLKNGELDVSWQALKRVGNLSSGSVLEWSLDEVAMKQPPSGAGNKESAGRPWGRAFSARRCLYWSAVVVACMNLCSSTTYSFGPRLSAQPLAESNRQSYMYGDSVGVKSSGAVARSSPVLCPGLRRYATPWSSAADLRAWLRALPCVNMGSMWWWLMRSFPPSTRPAGRG